MTITARFEQASVESLMRIGVHSHDELVDVATTSVVHVLCLSAGLQPGYPDRLGSAITPRITAGSSTSCAAGTRTVPCSESMSALGASRVAIWVAVHSGPAQFTRVYARNLSCGANLHEPRRTHPAQALNPRDRGSSPAARLRCGCGVDAV